MCPICWINGLIAFLIGMGVLAIDSPYTPWLIGVAVILTAYSMWKFHQGYQKWKGFSSEQRTKNWKTIKRFVQGIAVGVAITVVVFNYLYWEIIQNHHMDTDHQEHIHED